VAFSEMFADLLGHGVADFAGAPAGLTSRRPGMMLLVAMDDHRRVRRRL